MVFNIERFRSNLKSTGYLSSNKFEVSIAPPEFLVENYPGIIAELRYRIEEIVSPSTTVVTTDTMRYGVGTTQKMPWTAQTNEIGISILLDKYSSLYKFWYDWMNYIYNFNPTSTGGSSYVFPSYTTKYKDQYVTTMQLNVFDAEGSVSSRTNFYDVFPINIKEINYDWNTQNDLVKLIVTLSFKDYTFDTN